MAAKVGGSRAACVAVVTELDVHAVSDNDNPSGCALAMWPSTPHLTKRRKVEEIITHPLRYYVADRNHPRNSIDSGSK